MALDPNSYLPEFFTEERLRSYRELHERYPLWCGMWMEHWDAPEAGEWSLNGVAQVEFERAGYHDSLIGEWPREDSIPSPLFIYTRYEETIDAGVEEATADPEPAILGPWIAALDYILHEWGGNEPALSRSMSIRLRRRPWEQRLVDRFAEPERGTAVLLSLFREQVLNAKLGKPRKKAIQGLEQKWLNFGRAIGLVPTVKGGSQCALPGEFLAELLSEGIKISDEVRSVGLGHEETDWIRRLLGGGQEPLDDLKTGHLHELEKRDPGQADIQMRKWLGEVDGRLGTEAWATSLRFPFMKPDEIRWITNHSRKSSLNLASEILAMRLPVAAKTIRSRTVGFRNQ